jgi:hypothetical protein
VRLSANDIFRMAQRAAEGAGAPPGLDADAAAAVEWLELAGLPGVARLVADLDAGLASPDRCRASAVEPSTLRFEGASAILVGALGVEWAVAGVPGRRRIEGLVSPIGLLPPAAGRAAECGGIAVVAGMAAAAHFPAAGDASLAGDWARASKETGAVVIATGPDAGPLFAEASGRLRPAPGSLAATRAHRLRSGNEIEDAIWRRLMEHAARILVPANAVSRARGAGSGAVDDND